MSHGLILRKKYYNKDKDQSNDQEEIIIAILTDYEEMIGVYINSVPNVINMFNNVYDKLIELTQDGVSYMDAEKEIIEKLL